MTYNVTFPRAHAPAEPVMLSLFRATDCGAAATPLFSAGPLSPATVDRYNSFVTVTLPDGVTGDNDIILRVEGTVSGQRNYSDVISIQKKFVVTEAGCVVNPRLPVAQPMVAPPLHCRTSLQWNITQMATGPCVFESNSCRDYRCG